MDLSPSGSGLFSLIRIRIKCLSFLASGTCSKTESAVLAPPARPPAQSLIQKVGTNKLWKLHCYQCDKHLFIYFINASKI